MKGAQGELRGALVLLDDEIFQNERVHFALGKRIVRVRRSVDDRFAL